MKLLKSSLVALAALTLVTGCQFFNGGGSSTNQKTNTSANISATKGNSGQQLEEVSTGTALSDVDLDKPSIRLLSKGSILPSSGDMDLLFCAVNYAKAEVRVKKIYQSNILQFLQFDNWEVRSEIYKVAKQIIDTTVVLGDPGAAHIRENKVYGLGLDELITPEPGAIYHIEIRGREPLFEEDFWDSDYWFGDSDTYSRRSVDLLASNLALIAKGGDNGFDVYAYDILSGKPVSGAKVKLYDFVQQELGKATTDRDGHASFSGIPEGRFVVATNAKDYAYLDLKYGKSLSTSNFDVGGTESESGLKAYTFGERGVWRPGDTLHVTTIIMNDNAPLPIGHPVIAELRNPDGQVTQTITVNNTGNNIFHFPFTTQPDSPTGRWSVNVNVGGQYFYKSLRVETVKPNKLDITVDFHNPYITLDGAYPGTVSVNWLYGAVGKNLKVNGEIQISKMSTRFADYDDYDFIDDARSFSDQTRVYKDFYTDDEGKAQIGTGMSDISTKQIPGFLNAQFSFKAFEPGGEFSTCSQNVRISPFKAYVGIKDNVKPDQWGSRNIQMGTLQKFNVVTVGPDGKPVNVSNLHVEIFHVDYSWWWNSASEIANYMSGSSRELLFETRISTSAGRGEFSYDWDDAPNGCYYIRVSDEKGGHATSMICEAYNYTSSDDSGRASEASTKLAIAINKETFTVGETAKISIPSSAGSTAIVSLEKGGKCLSTSRVDCFAGSTEIQIPITADMLPNVYAFVTLIQSHKQTYNDAPIRLYGVQNINVEDASSHLNPVIDVDDEVKPETTLKFKVKEANGRAMSYVVALVDEGLLGLTNYKTPDAWNSFYAKEALRVRTWDVYDDVIGAYGGRIEQLFAIGGDDEAQTAIRRQKANRFTPVVAYLGPFDLKAGKTGSHSYDVPAYIGSLRAMVIATDGKAQGSCAKNVNVTKPVMVQATLPRTLAIGETIKVPVTVITMKNSPGQIKLTAKAADCLSIEGDETLSLDPGDAGQYVEYFTVKVAGQTGIGHFTVTASCAGDKSTDKVEIDVYNPNPQVTRLQTLLLKSGESREIKTDIFGIEGSNSLKAEVSSIPAIDLSGRMKYLTEYPYGCIEQTISAAFPQLYVDKITDGDEAFKEKINRHVVNTINRMQSFRVGNGALSYWPGSRYESTFGSVYALHFLQEAEKVGYAVPADLKSSLVSYISNNVVNNSNEGMFVRAYAAYALVNAGKPQRSAMNNIRESVRKMSRNSVWMLAASYAVDGKKKVAEDLVRGLTYTEDNSSYYYDYYGSEDRNIAVALKTSLLLGQKEEAFKMTVKLAELLNNPEHYMSTQSAAWALCSIFDYAKTEAGAGVKATVNADSKSFKLTSGKSMASTDLPVDRSGKAVDIKVTNNGGNTVYAVISATGIPPAGEEKPVSRGLQMTVSYTDLNGNAIRPDTLSRGTTFKSVVKVINSTGAKVNDIALTQRFPSGWEINNERLNDEYNSYPAGVTYQDIRDDRVNSFFDLSAGSSVTLTAKLTATYPGHYYAPAVNCEAMYDNNYAAMYPGFWLTIE